MVQSCTPSLLHRPIVVLVLAVAAGLLLRSAIGPEPNVWLIWFAPVPTLWLALSLRRRGLAHAAVLTATLVAATTYASYLRMLMPTPFAALAVCGFAAGWWLAIMLARRIVLRFARWWTVLAYPLAWAAIDLAMGRLLPDGQWGGAAYSQSEWLPMLQTAALGGTPALLFVLCLPASGLALLLATSWPLRQRLLALAVAAIVPLAAFGYGSARLQAAPEADGHLRIGLASIDDLVLPRMPEAVATEVREGYARLVSQLADDGAELIVLPEKAAILTPAAATAWQRDFAALARQHGVWLEVGVGIDDGRAPRNQAWLFDPEGQLRQDYEKLRLAPPERRQGYRHGSEIAVQEIDGLRTGLAICKDMHFASVGRRYGRDAVGLMLVPAWDFDYVDAWMGARMTLVRGVENGYAVVRPAREGLMSVSDGWGRLVAEARSAPLPGARLLAELPRASPGMTPYARVGDLFGLLCLLATMALVLATLRRGHASPTARRAH
jgi:apolipoprotein N-acyltransferase